MIKDSILHIITQNIFLHKANYPRNFQNLRMLNGSILWKNYRETNFLKLLIFLKKYLNSNQRLRENLNKKWKAIIIVSQISLLKKKVSEKIIILRLLLEFLRIMHRQLISALLILKKILLSYRMMVKKFNKLNLKFLQILFLVFVIKLCRKAFHAFTF